MRDANVPRAKHHGLSAESDHAWCFGAESNSAGGFHCDEFEELNQWRIHRSFETFISAISLNVANEIRIIVVHLSDLIPQKVQHVIGPLVGNGAPLKCEVARAGNDVLRRPTVDHTDIDRCVGWIETGTLILLQLSCHRFDALNQMRGAKYRRGAKLRISAMSLTSVNCYFSYAISFAGAHWLQRSWFANYCVMHRKWFCCRQTFSAKTTNLFISGKNKCKWFLQFLKVDVFSCRECGSYKCLCIARASTKEFFIAHRQIKSISPVRVVGNRVRVPNKSKFDRRAVL